MSALAWLQSRLRNWNLERAAPADRPWELLDIALLMTWMAGAAAALAIKNNQLFFGFDGGYMRELARRQFEWGVPISSASLDLYQGLGDIFFSGSNFTLLPSFIFGSWFGVGALAKVVTYTVAMTEYSLSIGLFARVLGLSRTQALAAGIGLPLLTFPLHKTGAIYGVLSLAPQLATQIAATLVLCVSLIEFGQRKNIWNLGWAAVFVGLMLWTVHSSIVSLVLSGPMLTLTFVSSLLISRDWRERGAKIALVAGTGVLCSGAFLYLLGLLLNTAPIVAPTELGDNRTVLLFASILFHWNTFGHAGPILVVGAMLGAFLAVCDRSRPRLRMFAIMLLTYFFTRLAFWITTVLFDFWRGPSALYFEFFVYPLYSIFAVFLIARIFDFWPRPILWWPASVPPRLALVCAAVAIALFSASRTSSPDGGFPYPPKPTAFTPIMQAEIEMVPPAPFRGRVINMTGRTIDHGITWIDLHARDASVAAKFGNEMRLVGLHYFSIPGFFQYGSTMTPAFYAFTSRLLSDLRDKQVRSVNVLRRYEPTLLAMLGVRFVVTDAPIAGGTPVFQAHAEQTTLYLYRVPDTNVGNYSPTEVSGATNATEILTDLGRSDFDPKRELIADVPGGSAGLVTLKESAVAFDGVSLHVTASSLGRSVLLLPLEYSRCLDLNAQGGSPELFRADLLLTGIVFSNELDAKVALRTGPFVNPVCRLHDLSDLLNLGIREIPIDVRK